MSSPDLEEEEEGTMTCYSDHNEDIRTKGSCDYCGSDELEGSVTFTLTIECDNEAFAGDGLTEEVARILRQAASSIGQMYPKEVVGEAPRWLRDVNGNKVGDWRFS